jgi:Flp pilus assembly protein TadG
MMKTSFPVRRLSRAGGMFRVFFRRTVGNTSGAAAIEFGVVVPVLALMVAAVIDIGLGIHSKMQLEDAAQAGVEWAIRNGFDANGISSAVSNATNNSSITATPAPVQFCGCASGSSISGATCGTPCPDGAQAGTYVTVSAQATYNTMINYPAVPGTYNFATQSTARLQ